MDSNVLPLPLSSDMHGASSTYLKGYVFMIVIDVALSSELFDAMLASVSSTTFFAFGITYIMCICYPVTFVVC